MTGHVVSFEPVGAPTRAMCSQCGVLVAYEPVRPILQDAAEGHAFDHAPDSTVEFAGLPPVGSAS